jgi:ParB family transcriptional regulator, chromosome partitioning protein
MDLECHQLDRRYEALRTRDPRKERQLLASLAEHGQQLPVVVVAADERFILVDGYKRLRALTRLAEDRVWAMRWDIDEPEALILEQLMRAADPIGPLEQGWALDALQTRFGLALADLARRFDKTASWVSRRLALVRDLPEPIHGAVRAGRLAPHAAMKYLVPLARSNHADCVRLVEAIAPHRLTTRQVGRLYQVYVTGPEPSRDLVLTDPLLVLRITDDTPRAPLRPEASAPEALLTDLHLLGAVARRARRRLQHGGGLLPPERARAWRLFDQVQTDFHDLQRRCEQELRDARSGHADGHLELASEGPRHPSDCPGAPDLPGGGPDGVENRQSDSAAD